MEILKALEVLYKNDIEVDDFTVTVGDKETFDKLVKKPKKKGKCWYGKVKHWEICYWECKPMDTDFCIDII